MAGLTRYLVFRIGRALATAVFVVSLVFVIIRAAPGDPVDAMLGDQASPEDRALVRKQLHLDEPLPEQYGRFWSRVLDGTLGASFRAPDKNVRDLLVAAVPHTARLAFWSLAVAWFFGIPVGVLSASRQGTWLDRVASVVAVSGLALPTIWLGPLLILAFSVKLQWLPFPGDAVGTIRALILPAITVGLSLTASLTRQTRAAMIEALGQPYVMAARARGLSSLKVLFKHALRNALLPVITVGAAQITALLSGAVIAEKIFERPGLGTLFFEAFLARDLPVVQGVILLVGMVYVSVNFALDLTYALVDPRVRLS